MTGISAILFFLFFFHSDCEFDHVMHTMSDAKIHGEADGFYLRNNSSKCSRVMDYYIKVCEGFVCFFTKVILQGRFCPNDFSKGKTIGTILVQQQNNLNCVVIGSTGQKL